MEGTHQHAASTKRRKKPSPDGDELDFVTGFELRRWWSRKSECSAQTGLGVNVDGLTPRSLSQDPEACFARRPPMAESLKTFFSPALVRRLAADLSRAEPDFRSRAFIKHASAGLEKLELLDRGKHIAIALGKYLPPSYPAAIEVLLRSLGPEHATDERRERRRTCSSTWLSTS
jgi:hypothetical protein